MKGSAPLARYTQVKPDEAFAVDRLPGFRGRGEEPDTAIPEVLKQRFDAFVKRQRALAYEESEQHQALKNLRGAVNERKALYEPTDPLIWTLTAAIADISLHFAVVNLKSGSPQGAVEYLQVLRVHTEPLPDSDWTAMRAWKEYRRDLHKNYSLYYQSQQEWSRALDSIRQGMVLESQLGDNSANTALTAAILLSKMSRFAESIEYS